MQIMLHGWMGIDPGATGAVALILEDGRVEIRDWPGDECALADLCSGLSDLAAVDLVIIESQQAMPKQGVVSTFKLGMNYGMWLSALAGQGWSFKTVRPAEWKKGLGYPAEKKGSKAHSLTLARRLYPQAAHMLGRVCDHGRAEALLLAHLAKEGKVENEISFEEAIA